MRILGIDPGSSLMGYGVVEVNGNELTTRAWGVLKMEQKDPAHKLLELQQGLAKILIKHKPDRAGVEKLYFSKNKKTALEVAQARGVILFELVRQSIPIYELTPNEVKVAVTSYGASDKTAVAKMVGKLLGLAPLPKDDNATDALAIAIAVSQLRKFN